MIKFAEEAIAAISKFFELAIKYILALLFQYHQINVPKF